jgi:DNA-binding beta-propeller fold protein YncE
MRTHRLLLLLISLASIEPAQAASARAPSPPAISLPGAQQDGSVLLPNQWSLRPVGRTIPLGDFPVNVAVHPEGQFAAVLHCGYGVNEVAIIDVVAAKLVSRVALGEAFYGIAFSPDGQRLYCSGAGTEEVHTFAFSRGLLSQHQPIQVRPPKERGVPAGIVPTPDGSGLWVAHLWGQSATYIDLKGGAAPSHVAFMPPADITAAKIQKPPADADLAAATKRGEAAAQAAPPGAPFPYACALDASRNRLYVSLWAHAAVSIIDTHTREILGQWPTQQHPNEILLNKDGSLLFVANANLNTVSVIDTRDGRTIETLSSALHPQSPPGSTPNSLALSPDELLLFVASACNNNVAVFDVTTRGNSRSLGHIPVGWYPTSVRVTPDGKRLLVANGKGITPRSNRHGPHPTQNQARTLIEYIGGLFHGTLSVIDLPQGERFLEQMEKWTSQARRCSPFLPGEAVVGKRPKGSPIPARVGDPSPIRYCIYILKENRTYDQILGDMPEGNGDPGLCLFPEATTPNHHKLAREFVLLDNFYVDSEVSADGHEWSMAAFATDYVEKTWPLSYGHNQSGKFPYPSEGNFLIAEPANGYLWDRARDAGVSYRSYGEFVTAGKSPDDPAVTRMAALAGHFDPLYRPWDMDYPDVKRAERFISELNRFEKEGDMPRLQILRLPNDHTYGTSIGKPTPTAMVADNDLAFGMLVEAVTRSRFWPQTAIFVLEDDAQNGADHVDAHRSIAYAISPYVKRRSVDSTMYSTCSMLRTMELILGLKPLTQFDAAATPMFGCFQPKPDLRPYRAAPVHVDRNARNLADAWGGDLSDQMNFAREDAADDLLLNEVIWRSVRGANSPMPAPVRAAFVRIRGEDDDD